MASVGSVTKPLTLFHGIAEDVYALDYLLEVLRVVVVQVPCIYLPCGHHEAHEMLLRNVLAAEGNQLAHHVIGADLLTAAH